MHNPINPPSDLEHDVARRSGAVRRVVGGPAGAAVAVGVAVAILVLLAANLPGIVPRGAPGSPEYPTVPVGPPAPVDLALGSVIGDHPADPFFAVSISETGENSTRLSAQGAFFNATPIDVYRLGGGGEGYDPTTGVVYAPPAAGGVFAPSPGTLVNLPAFVAWCTARDPPCVWLSYLPGEENDSVAALHYATWFHQVLHAPPTYWMFGNEPAGWTHFGLNQSVWSTADASVPTGPEYAGMVSSYIAAISARYPQDRYIGIESSCACSRTLIEDTAAAVGTRVAAEAFHEFPSDNGSVGSVASLMASLAGSSAIPAAAAQFRTNLGLECPACADGPVQIGAYQIGPSGTHSPYTATYDGAAFLAGSIVQALEANVSSFTVFSSDILFNATTGTVSPQGLLYEDLLPHLAMGTDLAVTASGNGSAGVYAIATENGSRWSLFLVNTNLGHGVTVAIPAGLAAPGSAASSWSWGPGEPAPVATTGGTLPAAFTVAPEGILLVSGG